NPQGALTDCTADFKSVESRQHEVQKNQVRKKRANGVDGFASIGDGLHFESLVLEIVLNEPGYRRVVFHDQYAAVFHAITSIEAGRKIRTVVPSPVALSIEIRPP